MNFINSETTDELLLMVFHKLDHTYLNNTIRLVSKRFKRVAEDNSIWRSKCKGHFPKTKHKYSRTWYHLYRVACQINECYHPSNKAGYIEDVLDVIYIP